MEAYLWHALSDHKSCLCLEAKKKKKTVRSQWENTESSFPQVQSFLRNTGEKGKEKAVVSQTFVGILQNVISKLKNGSWQNSW